MTITMDMITTVTLTTIIMNKRVTEKIKLWGIVQGVGFRPFTAKIADRLHMRGQVRNIGGLVEIFVTDTKEKIEMFLETLQAEKPAPAEIVYLKREEIPLTEYDGFTILQSDRGDEEAAMIPADIAVCPDCIKEMQDPQNKRYGHPLISCMICGPRYTITDQFPYDRENTSMKEFPMCGDCKKEYEAIRDRRYHAQTISCHECGPYLAYKLNDGREKTDRTDGKKIIEAAADFLKNGEVIAFKTMGGYNLMADPFNEKAAENLRKIKKRETKPFAVMFHDAEQVKEFCFMDSVEEKLITSSARPILLLERKKGGVPELERSRFIGSFLPGMGAQYLLLEAFGGPLIATSANLSSLPMIKDEEEMFDLMKKEPLIKAVIYNQRHIRVRADDSVVRAIDGQPQMIRRSKGYAPVPLYVEPGIADAETAAKTGGQKPEAEGKTPEEDKQIFAAGGQLKNSFVLSKGSFAYVSQYFGDMDSSQNREIYEQNLERMSRLFRIKPEKVVCDLHPAYYTTEYAKKYAEKRQIPLLQVQHHHAHVASVMAEHQIKGPIIGVSFDGTGYGTDGAVWGGEFLLCHGKNFQRKAHLKYVNMLGGDSSMKDGWKSALSYLCAAKETYREETSHEEIIPALGDIIEYYKQSGGLRQKQEDINLAMKAIECNINTIKSSSMGRLFDGVAALLGICEYNSYEGQCAILLEDAAARALKGKPDSEADILALTFHENVAHMILKQCIKIRTECNVNQVALTGGVFQNKILMEKSLKLLRENDFQPYYNISVSPNDGGIALGQVYIAMKDKE